MKPIGLYLHFPFCKQKCNYCDFNSYSGIEILIPEYIRALLVEVNRFIPSQYLVRSIYFGGGTPSYLPADQVSGVLEYLKKNFLVLSDAEITLEVNPGTSDADSLIQLRQAGFNRLSIGLQASQNRILKTIGRIHNWDDFVQTFWLAREVGFANIGVDLIFGLPGQSPDDWEETLTKVATLKPEHISAYGLQIEGDTPFGRMLSEGILSLPSETEVVAMMQRVMQFLPEHGYPQYEISNYARPGLESVHNLGYWRGESYLGFGAGATATLNQERWTNVRDPAEYIRLLTNGGSVVSERETIDGTVAITEGLMLGLRLRDGLDLKQFEKDYAIELPQALMTEVRFLEEQGFIMMTGKNLRLTNRGTLISNDVIARLLKYF